jgi:hypothetical protein
MTVGTDNNSKGTVTHKSGMPFGWVNKDGKNLPAFICSKSGKPITPDRPGTLYWNPDSGDMLVLSDEAEAHCDMREIARAFPYTTELDVHSLYLFKNTERKETRANAQSLASL